MLTRLRNWTIQPLQLHPEICRRRLFAHRKSLPPTGSFLFLTLVAEYYQTSTAKWACRTTYLAFQQLLFGYLSLKLVPLRIDQVYLNLWDPSGVWRGKMLHIDNCLSSFAGDKCYSCSWSIFHIYGYYNGTLPNLPLLRTIHFYLLTMSKLQHIVQPGRNIWSFRLLDGRLVSALLTSS